MSQVYDEPIVVRLTQPVGPYPVGTEFGFKDVADAIRALGSSAYFTVVRTQDGDPIPPPTPEDLTEAERQALERARAARLIRGGEFDKLVPGPGEVIVGSADGPVAQRAVSQSDLPGVTDTTVTMLFSGEDGETIAASNATIGQDTTNFRVGNKGLRVTTAAATTAVVRYDPAAPLPLKPTSAVTAWVYVPDPALVDFIQIEVTMASGSPATWIRAHNTASNGPLKTGWNRLRWGANEGGLVNWETLALARVRVGTNAATSVTIGSVFLEHRHKASILLICDGAHRGFVERAYRDFSARGMPVTWALEPGFLGTTTNITEAEFLDLMVKDTVGSSVSFHGYNGEVTATLPAADLRANTRRAQQWLWSRGFTGGIFRGAWMQNQAQNAMATADMVVGMATWTGSSAFNTWPPIDRFRMPRITLHGRTKEQIDGDFSMLKRTHQLYVGYTHDINADGSGPNMSYAEWDYFIGKVDQGLAEGWLEGVTFESLMAHSGAYWRKGLGGELVYEYYDEDGVLRQFRPV